MKEETTYGHQELINQVIDYIHTHLHKALTLEML
ncbi:AraC family transcriptional regulator, partial [Bacteroides uniformis]